MMLPLTAAASAALLAWVALYLLPSRPWDFQPVGEDAPEPDEAPNDGSRWPSVCVLVPAREEAETLPQTLPALLEQDYPGPFRVVLVDDRSSDGTAAVARELAARAGRAERLQVVEGTDLPAGWVGKMWALEQGARAAFAEGAAAGSAAAPAAELLLLTDADIRHAPRSVRRLVAESRAAGLGLNSRMARLRCDSAWERLLIPAFVFFFNLLYPMRRVNDPDDAMAAAAGGCVLLRREAFERMGGLAAIRDEIIDDVNLGRRIKAAGFPIRLALSRADVVSLRGYESLGAIWSMVRRTAFTELRYSWLRLAGALCGMALLFLSPWLALGAGLGALAAGAGGAEAAAAASAGGLGLAAMAAVYRPATRFFALPLPYAASLPLAALLYMAMTLDSAIRHAAGVRSAWRGRSYATASTS